MVLTAEGIKKGWATEQMPMGRIMSDALLTPDGKVIIVNGASQGIAGCTSERSIRADCVGVLSILTCLCNQMAMSETKSARQTRASPSSSRCCTTLTALSAGASPRTRRFGSLSGCTIRPRQLFQTGESGSLALTR